MIIQAEMEISHFLTGGIRKKRVFIGNHAWFFVKNEELGLHPDF
jgi:hypothetical protein